MGRVAIVLAAAAGVGILAWVAAWGLADCRPLDRLFGQSGCVAYHTVPDLTDLRRTVVFHPRQPSTLVIAGSSYQTYASSDEDRFSVSSQVVLYDLEAEREILRLAAAPDGLIEQLALSPDGTMAALTCNRGWSCDFPLRYLPEDDGTGERPRAYQYVPVALIDLESPPTGREAQISWLHLIPEREVPPSADGVALDLRFSTDGTRLVAAHNGTAAAAWSVADGASLPPGAPADAAQQGYDVVATADQAIRVAANRDAGLLRVTGAAVEILPLELPDGFIGELHMPLAMSPDGGLVAALARRFAGEGSPRAILQVWRLQDGARLARFEIDEDLHATLVWHPDGGGVLVAPVSEPDAGVGTELRLYAIADEEGETP